MKQKNLVLIAVAVGCGLVAAVLTSQMGAKPAQVDQVQVPVAAKDLSVGTKLSKDDLKKLVTYKKFNRDALPAAFAATEEELTDKRIVRTIRAGEPFNPKDLTSNVAINPPPGMNMVTFPMSPDKGVAGFAGPGSRVDILATIQTRKSNKVRQVVLPLLTDMLVLAVNAETQYPQNGQAFSNMSMVSLAVTNKQAQLLHAAIHRGADLRLVLLNPEEPAPRPVKWTEEEIWKILSDQTEHKDGQGGDDTTEKKVEVVKLPVPTEDLPAGTELTPAVIDSKFKMVDFTPPAPGNIVQNLREHQGKYLQNKLAANQFVPRSFLGDKLAKAPPPETAGPKSAPKNLQRRTKPPVYWDATIQTSGGMRRYRYQVLESGEYKFLGEVTGSGAVQPVPTPNQVKPNQAPEGKPSEGKKSDGQVY
jgi:Flp pilus assembly protein CpaB